MVFIESDFYHEGALRMSGGTLKVKGDYNAESAAVDVTDGKLTVDGDMHVKKDASLSLKTPGSRLHVKGDLNISSMQVSGNRMEDGVIEVGGDINCSEYASTESFSLKGTKLVLNGKEPQEVLLHYNPNRAPYEIDMTQSAGVTFRTGAISAKSIKGLDKIRNESLSVEDLQQNLEQDEVFHGDLMIAGKSLNLAGHDFVVEGDLELIDTILCPDEGLLKTGGNYCMYGSSMLVMTHTVDRLTVGGDFTTWSEVDHTNLLQRGRIGLYGNFAQGVNPYFFNSESDLLVAFMGDYTHYYYFGNPHSPHFPITYGAAEEKDSLDWTDPSIGMALYYGIQAGLIELAESPDEVIAAAAIGAMAGLGITLATSVYPPAGAIAAVVGIGATICEFCEDYKHISNIRGSYQKLREVAKLATIFAVTAMASGLGAKLGGAAGGAIGDKVHQVSAAVENQIKDWKIWKSTCDWMKKNILDNAKAFTDDVKNLWDEAVVSKIKGWLDNTKAQLLYKKQNLKADDIYAELKNLVDEDALDYLHSEYGTSDSAHLHLFRNVADSIETAVGEIQNRQISLKEVKYINEALQENVPQKEIYAMLKRVISTDELRFADDDLVYGPVAGGELRKFSNRSGGKLLHDLLKYLKEPFDGDWLTFSIRTMNETVEKNSMIHFDLTNMENLEGILNNVGKYSDKITADELRYIHENWSRFSKNVKFYYHDMEVLPPWDK